MEPSALASHQVPPKVLSTVVKAAPRSPQPGLPRRQMPAISSESTSRAIAATSSQVGASGMLSMMSERYITNDDSA